jgi:hypothetical protein
MHCKEEEFDRVTVDDFLLTADTRTCQNEPIVDTASTITYPGSVLKIPDSILGYYTAGKTDEVHAYSVINTKNLRITYHLPWQLEEYVTNIVEFYVKQLIPSTVILEFCWDYLNGEPPARRIPYSYIKLKPEYQSIRSYESTADIDIESMNTENIVKADESTTTRQ